MLAEVAGAIIGSDPNQVSADGFSEAGIEVTVAIDRPRAQSQLEWNAVVGSKRSCGMGAWARVNATQVATVRCPSRPVDGQIRLTAAEISEFAYREAGVQSGGKPWRAGKGKLRKKTAGNRNYPLGNGSA